MRRTTVTLVVEVDEKNLEKRADALELDGYANHDEMVEAFVRSVVDSNLQFDKLGQLTPKR